MWQPNSKLRSPFDIVCVDLSVEFALDDELGHVETDAGGGGHFLAFESLEDVVDGVDLDAADVVRDREDDVGVGVVEGEGDGGVFDPAVSDDVDDVLEDRENHLCQRIGVAVDDDGRIDGSGTFDLIEVEHRLDDVGYLIDRDDGVEVGLV